jgi:hypothetical protein
MIKTKKEVVLSDKPKRVYRKKVIKEEVKEEQKEEVKEEEVIKINYPVYDKVHEIEFPELKEKIKKLLNMN